MADIKIHQIGEIKWKKPTVVIGFPGTGLVGSVAASQLVEALKMDFVGYITSPDFAPLAAIHNYTPMPAARLHYSEKNNLLVILSEMTIPVGSSLELADKIYQFSKELGASLVVSLGGISLKEEENEVYLVTSDRRLIKPVVDKKMAKPIREGATTGVTGILLARGGIDRFPVVSILAESSEEYLDPQAAGNALRVLSALIGVKVDTSSLDMEAKEISMQLREKIIKSKVLSKKTAAGPADTSMYG